MGIFEEISRFGGDQCAVYIGARSFSTLALSSFRDALSLSVDRNVVLSAPSAEPPYAVRLISVNGVSDSGGLGFVETETQFGRENGSVFLKGVDSLKLVFSLVILSDPTFDVLSSIVLRVRNLRFQIEASGNELICAPGAAEITPSLNRPSQFGEMIERYGLDEIEVARVEGMLLYSGLASSVRNSMATARTVNLSRLFPGITFHGRLEFDLSSDGKSLFIRGSGGSERRLESKCECADVGNGMGPVRSGSINSEWNNGLSEPENGFDSVATITIGGPSKIDNIDTILGRRGLGEGDNGMFMPISMARSLIDGPFPGVRLDLRDDGFVGWKAVAFIDIDNFHFTPDPQHGRFFVTLKFRVEMYGSVHVDLGKMGKIRVTEFSAEQDGSGDNAVTIGFYFVIGTGGLFIKPILEKISFGEFEVYPGVFKLLGTPFGTKGAVVGFILDRILGQLIEKQIPIYLERELRTYMAGAMFPIMDAYYSAEIDGLQRRYRGILPLMALYDGDEEKGFLLSSSISV